MSTGIKGTVDRLLVANCTLISEARVLLVYISNSVNGRVDRRHPGLGICVDRIHSGLVQAQLNHIITLDRFRPPDGDVPVNCIVTSGYTFTM